MFRALLPAPFPDAARQGQFAALAAVLDAAGEPGVLLGNVAAFAPVAADALLVRPAGAVLLTLGGAGGHLTVPADPAAAWLLAGEPLQATGGEANPLLAFERQLGPVQRWLSEQLGQPGAALPPTRGLALFESALSFAPEVEARLDAAGVDFELLDDVRRLPARLRQPPLAAGQRLAPGALLAWADHLSATLGGALPDLMPPAADPAAFADLPHPADLADAADPTYPADFTDPTASPAAAWLGRHLRQLWRWLGAEDVPADPPYGDSTYASSATLAALAAQEAHLRQLRHELQAELLAQRQQGAAHEAARARELASLREHLPAVELLLPPSRPDPAASQANAQASAQASAQSLSQLTAQAAQQAARWHAAQAELTARNHELDARITQLSHLIGQLRGTAPAANTLARTGPAMSAATDAAPRVANQLVALPSAAPRFPRQRPWLLVGRLSLAGVVVVALGAGIWQVGQRGPKPTAEPGKMLSVSPPVDSARHVQADLMDSRFGPGEAVPAADTLVLADTATIRPRGAGPAAPTAAPAPEEPARPPTRPDSVAPAAPALVDSTRRSAPGLDD